MVFTITDSVMEGWLKTEAGGRTPFYSDGSHILHRALVFGNRLDLTWVLRTGAARALSCAPLQPRLKGTRLPEPRGFQGRSAIFAFRFQGPTRC